MLKAQHSTNHAERRSPAIRGFAPTVTFYLSTAERGGTALVERVLVLEADLGVTLLLPQPLRGLEQVQNPHEPQHEEKRVSYL